MYEIEMYEAVTFFGLLGGLFAVVMVITLILEHIFDHRDDDE